MTLVWSGVVTFVLLKVIGFFVPLRVREEDERAGLDVVAARRVAAIRRGASAVTELAAAYPAALPPPFLLPFAQIVGTHCPATTCLTNSFAIYARNRAHFAAFGCVG